MKILLERKLLDRSAQVKEELEPALLAQNTVTVAPLVDRCSGRLLGRLSEHEIAKMVAPSTKAGQGPMDQDHCFANGEDDGVPGWVNGWMMDDG